MIRKLLLLFVLFVALVNVQGQNIRKENEFIAGNAIIQLKNGYSIEQLVQLNNGPVVIRAEKLLSKHVRLWLITFDPSVHEQTINALKQNPAASIVQNNHYVEERATLPNDPSLSSQWHHVNAGSPGTADADIDSELAWDITTGGLTIQGDTIVVALVEGGGANYNHPDLLPNFWRNRAEIPGNSIDDDGNGYVDDFNGWNVNAGTDVHSAGGHGTQCFGMIAAKGNNSLGVVGANWNCKVMLVSGFNLNEAEVIAAYDYALNMRIRYNASGGTSGAFVVATTSSWGIDAVDPASYPLWCAFYDTLGTHGILNPCATTNSNYNVDVAGDMPTACSSDYVISVTRTDNNDNQAGGYGATTIDMGAPGINVYTTSGSSTYTNVTGTSFSTPLTAGVIALMYSAPCNSLINLAKTNPKAAADSVRSYLLSNVDPVASLSGITVTGGRLNSHQAVNAVVSNCSVSTCPAPYGLNETSITTTSATLTWNDAGTSAGFYYYYRAVGSPTWDSVYVTGTTANLSGLDSCTNYEWRVKADCSSEYSSYTSTVTFKTDGCCEAPTGITISLENDSTIVVTFNNVTAALNYSIQYKPSSSSVWSDTITTSDSVSITNLLPCTAYDLQIASLCNGTITPDYSTTYNFTTTGCGSCEDLAYCASKGTNSSYEYIDLVQLADINRVSGNDGGYILTGASTDLDWGTTYTMTVSPGYSGTPYTEYIKAWIDYNQDANFDETTELVFDTEGTVATTATDVFTVPVSALEGLTRLRVSMKYTSTFDAALPTPCLTFSYGEVEDYCVNIGEFTSTNDLSIVELKTLFYPNPTQGIFHLQLFNMEEFAGSSINITFYNAIGEKLYSEKISSNKSTYDFSDFAAGYYSYRITSEKGILKTGRIALTK